MKTNTDNIKLQQKYIKSTADIISTINSLASRIVDVYKEHSIELSNNKFVAQTSSSNHGGGECIYLIYFTIEIPKTTKLTVIEQTPIKRFNNILSKSGNLLYSLSEILRLQSDIIKYTESAEYNVADLSLLIETAEINKVRHIKNVKIYMEQLNMIYSDVKSRKYF